MAKLPSMQFYPGDWRKDPGVQSLSYEDRGIWFEILLLMFESGERGKLMLNGKKMPDEALAQMLGLDNQKCKDRLTTIIEYGVAKVEPETGIVYCSRMVKDEEIRKTRKKAGAKGGNPILLNQKSTTGVNQKQTPSSSSSSSSSNIKQENLIKGDSEKKKLDYTNEDLNLAQVFRKDILEFKPDFPFKKSEEEFAHDIQFIRRSKKKDINQILELWSWARQNEFWQTVILNPSSLNKNWGQLEIQRDRQPSEDDCDIDGWLAQQKKKERERGMK